MMRNESVTSIFGVGKLDQFVTYQLDRYQKVNRRAASEHGAGSVLHVKGRIGSVLAAPVGVPLILDLHGKHRVRMVTARTERVMTFGGLLD